MQLTLPVHLHRHRATVISITIGNVRVCVVVTLAVVNLLLVQVQVQPQRRQVASLPFQVMRQLRVQQLQVKGNKGLMPTENLFQIWIQTVIQF